MEANQYTEQDIQDYAAGVFEGDKSHFEEYLRSNPQIALQVKEYQSLYKLVSIEHTPSLSFRLSDRVLEKINQKEISKEPPQFQFLQLLVISLTVAAFVITFRQLGFKLDLSAIFGSGIFITSALLVVLVLSGFYIIEIRQIRRRLSL